MRWPHQSPPHGIWQFQTHDHGINSTLERSTAAVSILSSHLTAAEYRCKNIAASLSTQARLALRTPGIRLRSSLAHSMTYMIATVT